jgi:glycosyltransferase involved in cell wall biosynthesis
MRLPEHEALVLQNVPRRSFAESTAFRGTGQNGDVLKLLYQGYIGPENGLDFLLSVMESLQEFPVTLTVAGFSSDRGTIQRIVTRIDSPRLRRRVQYVGTVPRSRLAELIAAHDIGIVFYPWRHANHNPGLRLCAPNKLYEYIAIGLPVICTDNPPLKIVEENGIGWCIREDCAQELRNLLIRLTESRAEVSKASTNARRIGDDRWHYEAQAGAVVEAVKRLTEQCHVLSSEI